MWTAVLDQIYQEWAVFFIGEQKKRMEKKQGNISLLNIINKPEIHLQP